MAAVRAAAESVRPGPADKSFLEKRLADAIGEALEVEFTPRRVLLNRKLADVSLSEWEPQPGSFDVAVLDERGSPFLLAELKLDDVDQTLWDIFKLASGLRWPTVGAAYVVAGAPPRIWRSELDVVALFSEQEEWSTRFLFAQYRQAWQWLLRGGRARPVRLPTTISITPVARAPVSHYPPYELRAIRVERGAGSLPIVEDWPLAKATGELLDDELTPADLPSPDAAEGMLQAFALTTNGYDRVGSFGRCARLAEGALERWRRDRELPATLAELRCCLFFEQRRWRHYGYGFDDATLEYARALVEAMRPLVART